MVHNIIRTGSDTKAREELWCRDDGAVSKTVRGRDTLAIVMGAEEEAWHSIGWDSVPDVGEGSHSHRPYGYPTGICL